jgi:hypothetical protein
MGTMPTINVVDFGADPTAHGYSHAGIQAAFDSVPAQGATVFFPPGLYVTGATPVAKSNTKVRGDGRYASQIYQVAGTGPVLRASGNNVLFEDLAAVGLGNPSNGGGIDLVGATDSEVSRCIVAYCNKFGLRICGGPVQGDAMHNRVLGNFFNGMGSDGSMILDPTAACVLLDIPPGSNQSHPDGTMLSFNNFQNSPIGLKITPPTVDDSSSLLTDGVMLAMNETIEVERPVVAAATSLRVTDNRFEVTRGKMIFDYLAGTIHARAYDVRHRGNTISTYGDTSALIFNDATFDGVAREDFESGNKKTNIVSSQMSMRALRVGVDQVPAAEAGVVHLWADNSGAGGKAVLKARLGNGSVVTLATE